jgi:hypothetical protein
VAVPVVGLASGQGATAIKAAPAKPAGTSESTTTTTAPAQTTSPATTPTGPDTAAPTNSEKAIKAATDLSSQIAAGSEIVFEFKLVAPGQEKPKLAKALKAKVVSDGGDALSGLLAQAANDVLQVTIKK